jgi:putative transposase
VQECLGDREKARHEEWTDSIAVGSKPFVEMVKELLGFQAKGRRVIQAGEGYHVREESAPYNTLFGA